MSKECTCLYCRQIFANREQGIKHSVKEHPGKEIRLQEKALEKQSRLFT